MEPLPQLLVLGLVLTGGYLAGLAARRLGLPKVTGYLLAGVALSPDVSALVPADWVQHTGFATDLALAFITFEVGSVLWWARLRRSGRMVAWVTLLEAEGAFLAVAAGVAGLAFAGGGLPGGIGPQQAVPFALLLGALGSPTDPSATLAVAHEYRARGPVVDTILAVAALDDVLAIVNFSIAIALAGLLLRGSPPGPMDVAAPILAIAGSGGIGAAFGLLLAAIVRRGTGDEGTLVVVCLALLSLCFGVVQGLGWDPLLGTMAMGCAVVNASARREQIFPLLQRHTEELVFVLFFTLSGLHLSVRTLVGAGLLVVVFVVLRAAGKIGGARLGAMLGGAEPKVRRHVGPGLLPQGGIVVGLALSVQADPRCPPALTAPLLGIVIAATVVHEFAGPLLARRTLAAAGELPRRGGDADA